MITTIYLTRHGQTTWNSEGRMQGWKDSSLTALGIEQAIWLGERLENTSLDRVYSSTSSRAYDTAKIIIGSRNIPIYKEDDLREISLGKFQGLLQEEIKDKYSDQYYNYYNEPLKYEPIGDGETFEELYNRTVNSFKKIVESNKGKSILIVTHTMVVKCILCFIGNIPLERFWDKPYIRQTSLTKIEFKNDKYRILINADTAHHKFIVKEFNE